MVGEGCVVEQEGVGARRASELNSAVTKASVYRTGVVEGTYVTDVVLDTGCARTMVYRGLVPETKHVVGQAVTLRCVHGDTVLYPLAEVTIEVGGVTVRVQAAVSDTLPVSVLLGTDVPELGQLLHENPRVMHTQEMQEVFVVTRAQVREQKEQEQRQLQEEQRCGVQPTLVEAETCAPEQPPAQPKGDSHVWGSDLADVLFEEPPERHRPTKAEKREVRHERGLIRAKDPKKTRETERNVTSLRISRQKLQRQLEKDESLVGVREAATAASETFFWRDGLLYYKPKAFQRRQGDPSSRLVLPRVCRDKVLSLLTRSHGLVIWAGKRRCGGFLNDFTGQRSLETWLTSAGGLKLVRNVAAAEWHGHPWYRCRS